MAKYEANELINAVIRVGLPSENSTDQGTNFMSSLLNEVCKLLKIPPSHRVSYQPETDGLVE